MFGNSNKDQNNAKNLTKISAKSRQIDSLVGANTTVSGEIVFSGGLHVDGAINGNVFADGNSESVLTLGENGEIRGEVRVPYVVINGTVDGDIYAEKHIELDVGAVVNGNIYYHVIEISAGAEVNGQLLQRNAVKAEQEVQATSSALFGESEVAVAAPEDQYVDHIKENQSG